MSRSDTKATVTPHPEATTCEAENCTTGELLACVEPDALDEERTLCPTHRVQWLREVSGQ
jgi:hypothetical protein